MTGTTEEISEYGHLLQMLFEDAEYFLRAARKYEKTDFEKSRRYIRASIITTFTALEASINFLCFGVAEHGDVQLHEEAFLREKRLELRKEGYFELGASRFSSLEDRIRFLHWRAKGVPIPERSAAWLAFIDATRLRNKLVHPKPGQVSYSGQTVTAAKSCLEAVQRVAQMLG